MPQNNKPGRRLLRQLYGSWYRVRHNISIFVRWCLFAVIIGVVVGAVGAAFEHALEWATETRQEQSWTLYFLPLVGVFIAFWYSKMDMPLERGTNFILTSVRQDHPVRLRLAPTHSWYCGLALLLAPTFAAALPDEKARRCSSAVRFRAISDI